MKEKNEELQKIFPGGNKLITFTEAKLCVAVLHAKAISQHYEDGVNYIEEMLRKQLVSAIGKVVTASDFSEYMRYHNRRLFKEKYQPKTFCYAVRRPDHYPEGVVSIEAQSDDGSLADPIYTMVSGSKATKPMKFAINAATNVSFMGDRFLHGYVRHQFSGYSGDSLQLVARARQFSSFIILVGTIASSDLFLPKFGVVIQNKDDLKIPLMMETIPTPKEFKDAIASLSPEQQRFAQAYRGMQLASTLFGVVVIQIKPQLEKLLKVPYDSFTKEVELTEQLMELFIKYQIPSDLLSYDGDENRSVTAKVGEVKAQVKAMYDMINKMKEAELEEARKKAQLAEAERIRNLPPPKPSPPPQQSLFGARRMSPRSSSSSSRSSGRGRSAAPQQLRSLARAPQRSQKSSPPPPSAKRSIAPPPAPSPIMHEQQEQKQAPPADIIVTSDKAAESKAPEKDDSIVSVESNNNDDQVDGGIDYTKIPTQLNAKFEKLDEDSSLRATIIKPGNTWTKKAQASLLSKPVQSVLGKDKQEEDRNKAFDLLDALSRSGALGCDYASLHVVIASTHCFDKNLMNTVIQDNVNPIEKVERSSLIVATTIHNTTAEELVKPQELERVTKWSPALFEKK